MFWFYEYKFLSSIEHSVINIKQVISDFYFFSSDELMSSSYI